MIPESSMRVYCALGSTDMRNAINGLLILVEQAMGFNPFSGDLFVFCNRPQNIIKILYWDENGFCLWHKRLEEYCLKRPQLSGNGKTEWVFQEDPSLFFIIAVRFSRFCQNAF